MRRIAIQIVEHLSTRKAFYFIFTAMHFSIIFISIFLLRFLSILCILFRYIFYQILPRAIDRQEKSRRGKEAGRQTWQTHKFTFVFGVCCNTKLIFYGCAHLCSIEGRARRRGDGSADRGSRDICNKHTLFIVYGVCIC